MYKGYNLDLSVIEKQSFLNVTDYEIDLFEKKIHSKKNELLSRIKETIYLPRTEDNKIDHEIDLNILPSVELYNFYLENGYYKNSPSSNNYSYGQ